MSHPQIKHLLFYQLMWSISRLKQFNFPHSPEEMEITKDVTNKRITTLPATLLMPFPQLSTTLF